VNARASPSGAVVTGPSAVPRVPVRSGYTRPAMPRPNKKMPPKGRPSRGNKSSQTRSTASRPRSGRRRATPAPPVWTVTLDEHLSIEGDGVSFLPVWEGEGDAAPDEDEVVAIALSRIHELEQEAYDAARRLKDDDAEDTPAMRRETATYRRNRHRDALRLRRFVSVMERR